MNTDTIAHSAQGMMRNFGPEAAERARMLAHRYGKSGDTSASEVWSAIADTIEGHVNCADRAVR